MAWVDLSELAFAGLYFMLCHYSFKYVQEKMLTSEEDIRMNSVVHIKVSIGIGSLIRGISFVALYFVESHDEQSGWKLLHGVTSALKDLCITVAFTLIIMYWGLAVTVASRGKKASKQFNASGRAIHRLLIVFGLVTLIKIGNQLFIGKLQEDGEGGFEPNPLYKTISTMVLVYVISFYILLAAFGGYFGGRIIKAMLRRHRKKREQKFRAFDNCLNISADIEEQERLQLEEEQGFIYQLTFLVIAEVFLAACLALVFYGRQNNPDLKDELKTVQRMIEFCMNLMLFSAVEKKKIKKHEKYNEMSSAIEGNRVADFVLRRKKKDKGGNAGGAQDYDMQGFIIQPGEGENICEYCFYDATMEEPLWMCHECFRCFHQRCAQGFEFFEGPFREKRGKSPVQLEIWTCPVCIEDKSVAQCCCC